MKSLAAVVLAFVLLAGCATLPEGAEPLPTADVDAALQGWQAHDLPVGSCQDDRELYLVVAPKARVDEGCHAPSDLEVLGCLQHEGDVWIVYMRDTVMNGTELLEYPEPQMYIAHELRHWMGSCSGVGMDFLHTDTRLWYDLPHTHTGR